MWKVRKLCSSSLHRSPVTSGGNNFGAFFLKENVRNPGVFILAKPSVHTCSVISLECLQNAQASLGSLASPASQAQGPPAGLKKGRKLLRQSDTLWDSSCTGRKQLVWV